MSSPKHTFASSAAIRRAKSAVERTGAVIRSVKLFPDGSLELLLAENDDPAASEFDRLDAAGLL